jgi:hypothetical protein
LIETAIERAMTHPDEAIAVRAREARDRMRRGDFTAEVVTLLNTYVVAPYIENIINIAGALAEKVDERELMPEVVATDLQRLSGQRRHYRGDAWFKRRPAPSRSVASSLPVARRVACVHRGRRDRPRGRRAASRGCASPRVSTSA